MLLTSGSERQATEWQGRLVAAAPRQGATHAAVRVARLVRACARTRTRTRVRSPTKHTASVRSHR